MDPKSRKPQSLPQMQTIPQKTRKNMPRKLLEAGTQAQNNKETIIQLYQIGKTTPEINKLYPQISRKTLIRYLTKWGIPIRNKKYNHTVMENNKEKIIKQYKEGLTAAKIAEQYQRVNKITVLKYLKKWDVPIKHTQSLRRYIEQNHKNELIDLYKSGKNIRQIADMYPTIAHSTIHYYLSKWSVEMRASNDARRIWSDWCWTTHREVKRINEFYDHTCQICGLKQNPYDPDYSMKRHHQWGQKVTVILICKKCHTKTHTNNENDGEWSNWVRENPRPTQKVKEHYNRICQICGKTNTKLVIHHIWQNPVIELAVCLKCHKQIHKKREEVTCS